MVGGEAAPRPRDLRRGLPYVLAFVAILAAAAALRFIDLSTNPGSLYGDEAAEGLDALRMLREPGYHPLWLVWFTSDGGREALFAYVVSGAFAVFGDSTLVLREVAAAFGVAGVAAIGALAARWGRAPALAASGWAAGSLWLIAVSRDGMRNTIVPFFGAVALIAVLHWAARPTRGRAILAGAVAALSALYTYQALKLIPLLILVWLWWLRRANRPAYDRLRPTTRAAVAAFLVVAAPMLIIAVTEPSNYFGRAGATSLLNPGLEADVPYPIHLLRTLLMFGFFGDPNGRHDVSALPLLPIPLTIVGIFGVRRLWRARREPADALILLGLPIFLLPPLLFPDGDSPHFLRALGLAAPLGVTIGLGAVELGEIVRRRWGVRPKAVATALVAATLIVVAAWSGFVYLDRSVADRWDPYSFAPNEMAKAAAAQPNSAIILGGFHVVDAQFLTYDAGTPILDPSQGLADPTRYSRIFATSKNDLIRVLGQPAADRARVVVLDPWGQPAVWAVTP